MDPLVEQRLMGLLQAPTTPKNNEAMIALLIGIVVNQDLRITELDTKIKNVAQNLGTITLELK